MLLEGIYAYLVANAGMQAVLGTPANRSDKPAGTTGLFPFEAVGQPMLPFVVYVEAGTSPIYSFQGQNRLQPQRVRFSCYGSTAKGAKIVARALRIALNNIPVGPLPAGDAEAHGQFYIGEVDSAEPEGHSTIYGTTVDFEFWFIDTDPDA